MQKTLRLQSVIKPQLSLLVRPCIQHSVVPRAQLQDGVESSAHGYSTSVQLTDWVQPPAIKKYTSRTAHNSVQMLAVLKEIGEFGVENNAPAVYPTLESIGDKRAPVQIRAEFIGLHAQQLQRYLSEGDHIHMTGYMYQPKGQPHVIHVESFQVIQAKKMDELVAAGASVGAASTGTSRKASGSGAAAGEGGVASEWSHQLAKKRWTMYEKEGKTLAEIAYATTRATTKSGKVVQQEVMRSIIELMVKNHPVDWQRLYADLNIGNGAGNLPVNELKRVVSDYVSQPPGNIQLTKDGSYKLAPIRDRMLADPVLEPIVRSQEQQEDGPGMTFNQLRLAVAAHTTQGLEALPPPEAPGQA